MERTNQIARLNDAFRSTGLGGKTVMTHGVAAASEEQIAAIAEIVRTYDDFQSDDDGNDPYGEHDFGAIKYCGVKYFWKIDYYDSALEYGSDNPADPAKTTRVLTIMLATEY